MYIHTHTYAAFHTSIYVLTHAHRFIFHIHSKYTYSYTWMLPHRLTHILTHYCLHTYSSMLSNTFTVILRQLTHTHFHKYPNCVSTYIHTMMLTSPIVGCIKLSYPYTHTHIFTHSHKHWYMLAITDSSHAVTPFYAFTYLFSCVWVSPSLCRSSRLRLGEHWWNSRLGQGVWELFSTALKSSALLASLAQSGPVPGLV